MATDKRERQRQNRELKKAEEAKADLKRKRISIVKRYGFYTLIFAIALIVLKLFFG
ncbi:MAG: hypothetical protein KDB69_10455 [Acidimicrobiia bacterium]|nr:hypothetical protein [Acidimicrobiia bacterium]